MHKTQGMYRTQRMHKMSSIHLDSARSWQSVDGQIHGQCGDVKVFIGCLAPRYDTTFDAIPVNS